MTHAPAARSPVARSLRLRPAFTLVEVLVVMAILVIIAGTATVGIFKYLDLAKRREAEIKMTNIMNAANTYQITYDQFPTDASQLFNPGPDGSPPLLVGGTAASIDPWGQPYTLSVTQDNFGSTRVIVISSGNGIPIQVPKL
jgi:general secretion pathway protein G